jgi:Dockerin type I domain
MVSNLNDAPVAAAGAAPGTLRQAIFDANHTPGDDSIVFAPALTSGGPATINLSSAGQLLINSNISIIGPGAALMTVKAFDPTPAAKDGLGTRAFDVQASAEGSIVTIQGLTLSGGDVAGDGGAIRSAGPLTVAQCTITGNSARGASGQSSVAGGGIAVSALGSAQVTDSIISGNMVHGDNAAYGGGISSGGTLSLVRSMVTGNQADGGTFSSGGGIRAADQAVVTDCQITQNDAAVAGSTTNGPSRGGGIDSQQTLILSGTTISSNHAAASGGGISANVLAIISNSTISGNSAQLGGGVGGFEGGGGNTISVLYSTIDGNTGSGVRNLGNLTIIGSRIEGNTRDGVTNNGVLTISASTINNNLVGVTLTTGVDQSAVIVESVISNNVGGGIDHIHLGGTLDQLEVTNCTISGNSGVNWGGIRSTGGLVIDGSTINDNTATAVAASGNVSIDNSTISRNTGTSGGGISVGVSGAVTVTHSTITANRASTTGGGIFVNPGGGVALDHAIIAGNTLTSSARQDISGAVSARYSLIGDDSGATVGNVIGNQIGHAASPIDPQLGALANNGGPTKTQVPLVGSPVIDAGDPAAMAGSGGVPLVDGRGAPFTRVADGKLPAGAVIDIGAVEWQPHAPPELPGDFNLDGFVNAADYTLWRDTLGMLVEPYGGADADGNGKVEAADYQLWKMHFGESLAELGSMTAGVSIPAAVETAEPQATPVASHTPDVLESFDVGARPATTRIATATHFFHPRSVVAVRVRADLALVDWLAARRLPDNGQTSDGEINPDEAPASQGGGDVSQAADAVFHAVGTHRLPR